MERFQYTTSVTLLLIYSMAIYKLTELFVLVLNCVRLLTRILPYIFEDSEWRGFFWSSLPNQCEDEEDSLPLAQSLQNAICVCSLFVQLCSGYFLNLRSLKFN